ncbi:MAG: NADH-quinone oxidoreductase subunit NuoH [Vicinamibacteria bacterium]
MSNLQFELVAVVVKIGVLIGGLLGIFSAMTWVERRTLAFMQFRLGPNRTGPLGVLQPVADGIKLFFKEEVMPAGATSWAFLAAPVLAVSTALLTIAVIPYGPPLEIFGRQVSLQIADLDIGILYLFALGSLGVYGIVLAGWSANSKYSMLGALRSSAQMFSYELSLGLSWVGVIMLASSFRLEEIVGRQAGGFWHWHAVAGQPLAFVIYFIAATAEVSRTPFDLPEGETELVAGFHTEYSSMNFALMQMAEYLNMITVSVLCSLMFLGGWHAPVPGLDFAFGQPLGVLWLAAKAFGVLFVFIWLRGTLPRFRYDQLMHFGWKVLIPLAMLNVLGTAAWLTFVK